VSRLRARVGERTSIARNRFRGHLATLADPSTPAAGAERRGRNSSSITSPPHMRARRAADAAPSSLERFFDEAGGMQLVVHAPFGGRVNRAWGLALRKRFCRSFNFELQAAATEDAIVLSLGETHSFPLAEVAGYPERDSVRDILGPGAARRADVPDALALGRQHARWRCRAFRNGKRVPAPVPADACRGPRRRGVPGPARLPGEHRRRPRGPRPPAGDQTLNDCLHEPWTSTAWCASSARSKGERSACWPRPRRALAARPEIC
jgi:hypothetical protein